MGGDTGLRDIAGGLEAFLQVAEEIRVEQDLPVGRALEGTHGGLGSPTRCVDFWRADPNSSSILGSTPR